MKFDQIQNTDKN